MKYLLVVFTIAGFLVACTPQTTEIIETTETVEEIESSNTGHMPKADIGEGKVVYIRDCTRCHEQIVVEDFSSEQWSNILPRMIIKAELNNTESRQVTAYIEWELEND